MKLSAARIAVLVALGCGCGLTAAGSLVGTETDGGAGDGGVEGAALPESGVPDALADGADTGFPIGDAGLDVNPANCLAGCDGGTCDGGWCTFECSGSNCQNAPVVCPPGVPCAVQCTTLNACNMGVDCQAASACDIQCSGAGACTNAPVRCSGASCSVSCSELSTCNQGVDCDAGTCKIDCTGPGSCTNQPVECHSADCAIVCGDGANGGISACNLGVRCTSSSSCDILCQDQGTCDNQLVVAVAGSRADVRCTGLSSCNAGILTSAADGGALCKGSPCGPGIFCDGGACNARCDGLTTGGVCCKATTCRQQKDNGCTFIDSCP